MILNQLVELAEKQNDQALAQLLLQHMTELRETFRWLVISTRDRFNNEFGDENYSDELKRAMNFFDIR